MQANDSDNKNGCAINWLSLSVTILAAIILLVVGYLYAKDSFNPLGAILLLAIAIWVALVPGYIAFCLSKRNSMVGNVVYTLLFISTVGLMVWSLWGAKGVHIDLMGDLLGRRVELADEVAGYGTEEIEGEDADDAMAVGLDTTAKHTEETAEDYSGDERLALQVLAQYQHEVAEISRIQRTANDKITIAGGFNSVTFAGQADIKARMELLDEWAQSNESLAALAADPGPIFRQRLVDAGVSAQVIEMAVSNLTSGTRIDLQARIINSDRLYAQTCVKILQLLYDSYGTWRASGDGPIKFDKESDAISYNNYLAEVERINQVKAEAQKELMEYLNAIQTR